MTSALLLIAMREIWQWSLPASIGVAGIFLVIAHYGFMERPDIPLLLAQLKEYGCTIDLADVTYFVGHETVTRREDGRGLPRWQEALFAAMERNAAHVTDYYNLPGEQVVEIGRQIAI